MTRLTAADLVNAISQLELNRTYTYVSGKSRIEILRIVKPEGPIAFVNVDAAGSAGRTGSISAQQLTKMALVCSNKPNYPLHIDRVFSAGGNSRSAFETPLAHTPHFFMCYPS